MAIASLRRLIVLVGTGLLGAGLLAGCGAGSASPPNPNGPIIHKVAKKSGVSSGPSRWLTYQASAKTATLKLVAAYNGNSGGFNYDGYGNGKMVVSIPTGWKVTVNLTNKSSLPHSAAIVTNASATTPAFSGASIPSAELTSGIGQGQTATFTFTAGAPGTYRIACLVPGHEALGMWDTLQVTSGGTPSVNVKA